MIDNTDLFLSTARKFVLWQVTKRAEANLALNKWFRTESNNFWYGKPVGWRSTKKLDFPFR
jgi:hypothetical protein